MGALASLFLTVAVAAPIYLDLSAIDPEASDYPVSRLGAGLCGPSGAPDGEVLAAAIVTYGRRPGRSAWGHTSLRFLACENGLLRDVEYETYRMDASIERWFRLQYPGESWTAATETLRAPRGQLMVVRNERPADGGFFAAELARNREVVVAWMPWSEAVRTAVYASVETQYARQLEQLRGQTTPDGVRYRPMGTNCTLLVREALAIAEGRPGEWSGSVFPMQNLRALELQPGVRLVLHPSPHVIRSLADAADFPEMVLRVPHGIVRRRPSAAATRGVTEVLWEATPVVVGWLLDGDAP